MNNNPMNSDPLYYHSRCEMRLPKDVINNCKIKRIMSIDELQHIELCEDNEHNPIEIQIDLAAHISGKFDFDSYVIYQYGNRNLKIEESLYHTIKGGEDKNKKCDLAYILVNKNTYESIFLLGEIKYSLTVEQFFKARRQIVSTLTDLFIIHSLLQVYPSNVSIQCTIFTKNNNSISKSENYKSINARVYKDEKNRIIPMNFLIYEYLNRKIFCGIDHRREMNNFDKQIMEELSKDIRVLKPIEFDIKILP